MPYLLIDQGGHREAVETVSERLPQPDVVSTLAFIVEAVYAIDGGTFVISSEQKEVLGILDLHGRMTSTAW